MNLTIELIKVDIEEIEQNIASHKKTIKYNEEQIARLKNKLNEKRKLL